MAIDANAQKNIDPIDLVQPRDQAVVRDVSHYFGDGDPYFEKNTGFRWQTENDRGELSDSPLFFPDVNLDPNQTVEIFMLDKDGKTIQVTAYLVIDEDGHPVTTPLTSSKLYMRGGGTEWVLPV